MIPRRRSATMASFLAFLAVAIGMPPHTSITVEAFQSTCSSQRQPWDLPLSSSTALTARRHAPPSRSSSRGGGSRKPTATYYSTTADPPFDDKKRTASFGNRMRNIVLKDRQKTTHNPNRPSFVEEAVTLQEYKEMVADETERIVVVRFYAKWCKACKAAEPYFYRLAKSLQSDDKVKFVEVPVLEENANLHQGLGVPALPFAHIYSPTLGLVEELRLSKKEFKSFANILNSYVKGECADLEMDPDTGMYLSPYKRRRHELEEGAETDAEPVNGGTR